MVAWWWLIVVAMAGLVAGFVLGVGWLVTAECGPWQD